MAVVKCVWCSNKDDKVVMTQEENKKYYHSDGCHAAYQADRAFKKKEAESKLEMSIKIAKVYGLESYKLIPSTFYPYIEDLRNDSTLFGKMGKNYKAGIPYEGIAYTYEFCKDRISEARSKIEFKNFMGELKYGLAIIRNSLVDAKNHAIQQKRMRELSEIEKAKMQPVNTDTEVVYKKKENKNNISEFL